MNNQPKPSAPFMLVFFIVWIATASCFSQTSNNEQMSEIYAADQKDREDGMKITTAQWQHIDTRDDQRREQVRKLLDNGALVTGEDFEHAAFVFQHGNRPEDYLMAHILAVVAVARGDAKARWISAATLDRYLQAINQPQVFGTQYGWKATPRDATQDPYNRDLVPDPLRHEFCVSSRAQQAENLKMVMEGKDLPHMDGCR